MGNLRKALADAWRAAEVLETLANMLAAGNQCRMTLTESRLIREKMLDAQIKLARAERYLLEVPIKITK